MPIQVNRKPVFVFANTDEGAPQLTGTAGSLKTVLKACLDTGYGSKQGLGWQTLFEDSNSAIFKMAADNSTQHCLKIDNTQARAAVLTGCRSAGSLSNMTGAFNTADAFFAYLMSNQASGPWMLVGHDAAFAFMVKGTANDRSRLLFFGDYPSYLPLDEGNCLLAAQGSPYAMIAHSPGMFPMLGTSPPPATSACMTAKAWDRGSVGVTLMLNHLWRGALTNLYPDPVSGGLDIVEIYLHEYIANASQPLRGLFPGLMASYHNLNSVAEWSVLGDFAGSDDQFVKLSVDHGQSHLSPTAFYLLNITAWPS